jgi:hypothetical protein
MAETRSRQTVKLENKMYFCADGVFIVFYLLVVITLTICLFA